MRGRTLQLAREAQLSLSSHGGVATEDAVEQHGGTLGGRSRKEDGATGEAMVEREVLSSGGRKQLCGGDGAVGGERQGKM
ncbi:hypothetical protein CRG98_047519 [Punica granatum]|uniref:Uncharacterized protein n=1 Tax=Punica granatum TaxID=22663 RepID=A0A2I0HKT8_PUNGR|nr:hypothetical protein CRG98_047519 [Punica granatum]